MYADCVIQQFFIIRIHVNKLIKINIRKWNKKTNFKVIYLSLKK